MSNITARMVVKALANNCLVLVYNYCSFQLDQGTLQPCKRYEERLSTRRRLRVPRQEPGSALQLMNQYLVRVTELSPVQVLRSRSIKYQTLVLVCLHSCVRSLSLFSEVCFTGLLGREFSLILSICFGFMSKWTIWNYRCRAVYKLA